MLRLLAVALVAVGAPAYAGGCRTTLRNLSTCAWMNGLAANASQPLINLVVHSMENELQPHYNATLRQANYSGSETCKNLYFEFLCATYASLLEVCDARGARTKPCNAVCTAVEDCFSPPLPRGAMCASLGFAANGSACVAPNWTADLAPNGAAIRRPWVELRGADAEPATAGARAARAGALVVRVLVLAWAAFLYW